MESLEVRVFAEWAVELPLWAVKLPEGIGTKPPVLSEELTRLLRAGNQRWEELADDPDHEDDKSWSSWGLELEWNREGYDLARRLRAELPVDTRLVYYDYITDEDVLVSRDS
jgi:hypothetical protein